MKKILSLAVVIMYILTACSSKTSKELYESAEAKAKAGNYKDAIADYDKAIEKDTTINIVAIWHRGNTKTMVKDYQGAVSDYSIVIEKLPKNANAYMCRATGERMLNNFAKAIADLDKAIQYDSVNAKAYHLRGFCKMNTGNNEAFADLNKAISLDPKLTEAYLDRGQLYLKSGLTQEACADLTMASQLGNSVAVELVKKNCK
ncbi:MAG: hypothetical protein Q8M08_08380 [Bacteroidales bacterium]|nr:hypothetical protein [Bacteroidales bacterium]